MPFHTNTNHNNHNTNTRSFPIIRLKHILDKQKANERVYLQDYLNAIVNESKIDKNYDHAETLFRLFLNHLDHALSLRPKPNHIYEEINIFQKVIATLIRYAPEPQKALNYTAYLLDQKPPLRTEHVEATCLINLIFVYGVDGSPDAMQKALELIQVGLDRKVCDLVSNAKNDRDNVATVFVQVSRKILDYHSLQFTANFTKLVPSQRSSRPQRFSTH